MNKKVRVRFAPSPTGALHIGGVRTALYNYLFAKKNNGAMILRIEDTDQNRFVEGAEDYIKKSLEWCGIELDEGPDQGGEFGPYRQSERKDLYAQYAEQLIKEDKAYYAFDTPEEENAMKEKLREAGVHNPSYNAITRHTMNNSLTLSAEEVKKRLDAGEPYVIRIKIPKKEEIRFEDEIRGWIMVHSSALDDKILMKSDGMPTYHMANIVDDHLMQITHVIRGEEWLPSAPLHVFLYKALGWESTMPKFAHLPLLLKPEGTGKLSKRDADKHGFPIFPLEWKMPSDGELLKGFKESGYLPNAFVNFLAMLGWNPGTEQELFDMPALIETFSLDRVAKAGAKFDINKANWFNEQYIKDLPAETLVGYLKASLTDEETSYSEDQLISICELMRERITFPGDLYEKAKFLFERPASFDEKTVRTKWKPEAITIVEEFGKAISNLTDFNAAKAKETLFSTIENAGMKLGKVMPAVRLAITGAGSGPDLMIIMEVLGVKEVSERINHAVETIVHKVEE